MRVPDRGRERLASGWGRAAFARRAQPVELVLGRADGRRNLCVEAVREVGREVELLVFSLSVEQWDSVSKLACKASRVSIGSRE